LQTRIDSLDRLYELAVASFDSFRLHNAVFVLDQPGALHHRNRLLELEASLEYGQVNLRLGQDFAVRLHRLLSGAGKDLIGEAVQFAGSDTSPGTPNWRHRFNQFLKDYYVDGQALVNLLRVALEEVRSQHRSLEDQHNALSEATVDDLVRPHSAELAHVIEVTKTALDSAQAVYVREETAIEAVEAVWRGTQNVMRWVSHMPQDLSHDDQALARTWARDQDGSKYWASAMVSARGAELVAMSLYRDLYGEAEDLSILQHRTPHDFRWQTADIATAGRWVDVKNARQSYSSPTSYSEHCVKQFKSGPGGRGVIISGFLSPYVTDDGRGADEPVVWLGETTLEAVENLRRQFETDYLKIDLSGGWSDRIPPWVFEYPPKCYVERDAAIRVVASPAFVLPRRGCPLGLLVLTGRAALSAPLDPLSEEVHALARRIETNTVPTRPELFLHVLDRFCHAIRNGKPFPADILRQILFADESLAPHSNDQTPLAVLDPLETIKEVIGVLAVVADRCPERVKAFPHFKLTGSGVLKGRPDNGNWQTILAYCGGWGRLRDGRSVKCGQSPLFLGQNEPCDTCGRLVCHQCGYCSRSEYCTESEARQVRWGPLPPLVKTAGPFAGPR
jgi:hypothetical protein